MTFSSEEWLGRCIKRYIDRGIAVSDAQAAGTATFEAMEEAGELEDTTPEEAADEDLLYWDGDEVS